MTGQSIKWNHQFQKEACVPRLTAIRKQALDDLMKKALFDATVTVLCEHGAKGLTMDRVAFAAGVAKGSLYHYFRSKRNLVEFVYAKTIDPLFQDLEELIASDRPAVEKLSRHVHALLEHVAAYAQVFKLLFEDDTAHGLLQSSERSRCEAAGERIAEIFSQGIAEGAFVPRIRSCLPKCSSACAGESSTANLSSKVASDGKRSTTCSCARS